MIFIKTNIEPFLIRRQRLHQDNRYDAFQVIHLFQLHVLPKSEFIE